MLLNDSSSGNSCGTYESRRGRFRDWSLESVFYLSDVTKKIEMNNILIYFHGVYHPEYKSEEKHKYMLIQLVRIDHFHL